MVRRRSRVGRGCQYPYQRRLPRRRIDRHDECMTDLQTRLRDDGAIESPVTAVGLALAGCAGGGGARVLHRHVRCRGAQRFAAVDPGRSRRRDHRPAVGRRRLHVDVRRPAACRRSVQRPHGARRAFIVGVVGFVAASAACGLAPGSAALIAARFVQGSAAAVMMPASMALIGQAYPNPSQRARAVGDLGDGRSRSRRRRPRAGWAAHRRVVAADLPHQHPRRHRRRRPRRPQPARRRAATSRSTGSASPPHWWRWAGSPSGRSRPANAASPSQSCCAAFVVAGRRRSRHSSPGNDGAASDRAARAVPPPQHHRGRRRRVRVRRRLLRAAVRDEPVPPAAARPVRLPDRPGVRADDDHRRRADPVQRPRSPNASAPAASSPPGSS